MTEQDRSMSMITLVVTCAKHAGTGTINVRKQCGMRLRYAVKQGGRTRVKGVSEKRDICFNMNMLISNGMLYFDMLR